MHPMNEYIRKAFGQRRQGRHPIRPPRPTTTPQARPKTQQAQQAQESLGAALRRALERRR